jgi:hypothetical protein
VNPVCRSCGLVVYQLHELRTQGALAKNVGQPTIVWRIVPMRLTISAPYFSSDSSSACTCTITCST